MGLRNAGVHRIAHASPELAARALAHWDANAVLGAHLGSSASTVFSTAAGGRRRVLRLTDARFRSRRATEAEIHFTEFLGERGVRVSRAVRTHDGRWTIAVPGGAGETSFVAMLSSWAPGILVDATSAQLGAPFAHAWGASLAELHRPSTAYVPADPDGRRPWTGEVWVACAGELLAGDAPVRSEYEQVLERVSALPKTRHSYGMLHNDHGPQNFRVDSEHRVTLFDFGNACYGWYAMDLMPPVGYLRRIDGGRSGALTDAFVAGYRSVRRIDDDVWAARAALLRFRRFYVYLSRLWAFGAEPPPEERAVLATLRSAVLEPAWNF